MHHFQPKEEKAPTLPVPVAPTSTTEATALCPEVANSVETSDETDVEALFATMRREVARQRRWNRGLRWLIGIYLSVLVVGLVLMFRGVSHIHPGIFQVFNVFNLLTAAVLNSKQRKEAVGRLSQLREKRAVGPLCDVLEFKNPEMTVMAKKALTELLPTLQASDAPLLNREQRAILYRSLSENDLPFSLVILKALEQIGDGKALPAVQKMAQAEAATAKQKEVREAARACLPFLEERAEREKISSTLLRASEPTIHPEVLLRPAETVTSTSPDELLRVPDEPPARQDV